MNSEIRDLLGVELPGLGRDSYIEARRASALPEPGELTMIHQLFLTDAEQTLMHSLSRRNEKDEPKIDALCDLVQRRIITFEEWLFVSDNSGELDPPLNEFELYLLGWRGDPNGPICGTGEM